ncbi:MULTISPECIES: hypothetical protein [Pseudomonas]|jgi:hypothetical protein|uniref:Uncharacterized protein n=2 Tax=Pseudomonas putida TaxID=303 RepID=A0A7V8EHZ5_PSEPU|nr:MULTISPECIES: hypothetical protein [Pseudomonas]EKT4463498.1 hypothetical protein [Pseudomonas putida]EKT4557896.1 hypothetical protein [Pseudomonas putida]ELF6206905.1 hypothetical protein [Pseudomonas putida]ELU0817776.1 hypothetical protein [Pseudomonas putida]KAF0255193.1 hypothetical protein GN299_08810 [Pseudomonas putida]
MIYLFLALLSYTCTYYLVGLLIQGQLADVAEGLRHRPDAPTPGEYLRAVKAHARRAHRQYTLMAGSALALLACLVASWFS